MRIATLIALVQLSLATAVSDEFNSLTAAELNLQLSPENALSPFYESSEEGVTFVRGSRAADSPLSPDIDVQCSNDYIDVTVEFSDIYDGIIYSKGYLSDPNCKYVSLGGSQSRYSFRVPLNGCGSRPLCNACGTIDNVLVFQADDFIQGSADFARKISCVRTTLEVSAGSDGSAGAGALAVRDEHTLKLKPFMVDMLDIVAVQGPAGGVECWMDIQKGVFPNTTPLKDSIKIGEYLTILVYLKDVRNQFNLKIHDCWAYDSDNYDSPKTNKIQLTDKQGCPKKKKLIDLWQKSTNTGKSGATLIAYSKVSAFRFPETDQVYLTCNVELCTSSCDASCDGIIKEVSTTIRPDRCYPGSREPGCQTATAPPQIKCYPGSTDPRCPQPTTSSPLRCYPGSNDPRCPKPTTPEAPRCYPGSSDPRCPQPTTPAPPRCFPGSTDPRCPKPTTPEAPRCYPGSSDPRCPQPTTPAPPRCFPGSTDPRCPKPTTPEAPRCYPGSSDPRCPQPTTPAPPKCFPGSTDPRCPKPTTPEAPRCYPGSSDPRCPQPTTPAPPRCFPGSSDPRCPKPTTPEAPRCYPGSSDPRCPQPTTPTPPRCFPGSTDPRCPKPTTPEGPRCYPGSSDPRCPNPTIPTPSSCYPGSKDPKCPQPFAPSSTNPPSTYLPPFPDENEINADKRISANELSDDSLLGPDFFQSERTKPRSRTARDVSGISEAVANTSNGIFLAIGATAFMVLSVTLMIYLLKCSRKENRKTANPIAKIENLC
ncbi:proteoglycan 4-like [Bombyx mandarina]|uniref:Proteoglycan 4-like n=1 Tax=Bombyx mandarina TaxID=7092 RepID=A0A6J2KKA4_BOMMA|nr:proteoglycan 4-like [Bombyx mandarina]